MPIETFLTIGIAFTALVLSSINTYYQFFSVRHSLALASYDLTVEDGDYHAELIISNTGNKPFTATSIHFCLKNEHLRNFEDENFRHSVDTYVDDVYSHIIPSETLTVILPGEIRIFRLKSSFNFAQYPIMRGKSFNVAMCLTAYTSEAEKTLVGIMPFWMEFDDSGNPKHAQRRVEHGIFDKEHRKMIDLSKLTLAARGLAR